MGACLTLERDEMIARKRSEEIDKQLDALAKERPRILKILLLGAGESGKLHERCFIFFSNFIIDLFRWNLIEEIFFNKKKIQPK